MFVDVISKWESQGVALLPPNDRVAVIDSLNSLGKKYSSDIVDLYCSTGGMKDWGMDNYCWSLWSLDQLVNEDAEWRGEDIRFGDFLINSHFYLFRYESDEKSSVWIDYVNGNEPEKLSGSIQEFFDQYLKDPNSLAMWAE